MITRRFFLGGAIAVAAAVVVKKIPMGHTIWGDGIHYDSDGLNALFRGDPVNILAEGISRYGDVAIDGGRFRLDKGLIVRDNKVVLLSNLTFITQPSVDYVLTVESGGAVDFTGPTTIQLTEGTYSKPFILL